METSISSKTTCPHISSRQQEIIDFCKSYLVEHHNMPTYREIGAQLGVTHKCAYDYVQSLFRKGVLERISGNGKFRIVGCEIKIK